MLWSLTSNISTQQAIHGRLSWKAFVFKTVTQWVKASSSRPAKRQRISPYNINTISSQQVMRIKEKIGGI